MTVRSRVGSDFNPGFNRSSGKTGFFFYSKTSFFLKTYMFFFQWLKYIYNRKSSDHTFHFYRYNLPVCFHQGTGSHSGKGVNTYHCFGKTKRRFLSRNHFRNSFLPSLKKLQIRCVMVWFCGLHVIIVNLFLCIKHPDEIWTTSYFSQTNNLPSILL